MGSGLVGGPLTGSPPTGSNIAPAGQSAILAGPLGAGATDVVTKIGSTVADGSVNAGAKLTSFRTGINGTEVEYAYLDKLGLGLPGAALWKWAWRTGGGSTQLAAYMGTTALIALDASSGFLWTHFGLKCFNGAGTVELARIDGFGMLSQYGTDSTGTPGAATIDKPTGKSSIAIGAASVTVTSSQCAAASRVLITPHARDATCKELIVVPGAGSFVVSGTAAATAALPFSWQISNIL
jgi:hypothetical protein